MRAARVRSGGALLACAQHMRRPRPDATSLRAEAKLLGGAGLMLLAAGFPATLWLVGQALASATASPALPALVGAPPLMLGYLACHVASVRLARARALEDAGG